MCALAYAQRTYRTRSLPTLARGLFDACVSRVNRRDDLLAEPELFLLRWRGVRNLGASNHRELRDLMHIRRRIEDVPDVHAARGERVGDQRPVTAPRHSFRAHDG